MEPSRRDIRRDIVIEDERRLVRPGKDDALFASEWARRDAGAVEALGFLDQPSDRLYLAALVD